MVVSQISNTITSSKDKTLAVDGEDFSAIGEAFEQTGAVCHAPLGNGMLSMMRQRTLVDFAVKWIEENRKCQDTVDIVADA